MKQAGLILLLALPALTHAVESTNLFVDPAARAAVVNLPAASLRPQAPVKSLDATIGMVMRLRHESPKVNGVIRIDHGTGALVDGLILTARHVVEGAGKNLCEVNGKWVQCRVIVEDADLDIAVLEPQEPIVPQTYAVVDGCHSSVKGTPIAVLPAKKLSTLWMNIEGFHHGASGSPVIKDGRVIAVAVAMRSEEESNTVQIVPAIMLQEIWEQAKQNINVASSR